ncbi:MAG: carotenoid oxygenase family protein [Trebonia sp.]
MGDNIFLTGNWLPVREERTVTGLAVTGEIPGFLDGRYLRNGPNPAEEIDPDTYHLFMGDGMVHGVRVRDGKAEWYRNRWVRSQAMAMLLGEQYHGKPTRAPLPNFGANTNVIGHAGRILAVVESGAASFEMSGDLDTVGACDFDGTLQGGFTAHPKRDPETGELHAVSYYFGWGNKVRYQVIDTAGRVRRTVDIPVTGSPMMHDFSLTRSRVVLYDLPVTFDVRQAVEGTVPRLLRAPARLVLSMMIGRVRIPAPPVPAGSRRGTNDRLPYRWNPRYPARIGVMPREGGAAAVRWFEIEPCYVFHPLNAYDADDGTIVLDVVRYDKVFDQDLRGPAEGDPALFRWTVDPASGKVRQEQLDDRMQEFPRVDERVVGRRHRYGYTVLQYVEEPDALLKHDLDRGTTEVRSFGAGREPGEFVFVPRTADAAEDDGVLMGFVYDAATDRSDLMLLDAATLEDVAAIHLPTRVPNGFHGNWIPDAR